MAKNPNSTRGGVAGLPSKSGASKHADTAGRGSAKKGASGATFTGKAVARPAASGRLSASRIAGPTPGPRTISDEAIRDIVRAVIRKRSAPADA